MKKLMLLLAATMIAAPMFEASASTTASSVIQTEINQSQTFKSQFPIIAQTIDNGMAGVVATTPKPGLLGRRTMYINELNGLFGALANYTDLIGNQVGTIGKERLGQLCGVLESIRNKLNDARHGVEANKDKGQNLTGMLLPMLEDAQTDQSEHDTGLLQGIFQSFVSELEKLGSYMSQLGDEENVEDDEPDPALDGSMATEMKVSSLSESTSPTPNGNRFGHFRPKTATTSSSTSTQPAPTSSRASATPSLRPSSDLASLASQIAYDKENNILHVPVEMMNGPGGRLTIGGIALDRNVQKDSTIDVFSQKTHGTYRVNMHKFLESANCLQVDLSDLNPNIWIFLDIYGQTKSGKLDIYSNCISISPYENINLPQLIDMMHYVTETIKEGRYQDGLKNAFITLTTAPVDRFGRLMDNSGTINLTTLPTQEWNAFAREFEQLLRAMISQGVSRIDLQNLDITRNQAIELRKILKKVAGELELKTPPEVFITIASSAGYALHNSSKNDPSINPEFKGDIYAFYSESNITLGV